MTTGDESPAITLRQRRLQLAAAIVAKMTQRLIGDKAAGVDALDLNTVTATEMRALLEFATRLEAPSPIDMAERLGARVTGDE